MSHWANEEQQAHMRALASIPREDLCPSGWHVKPGSPSSKRFTAEDCPCTSPAAGRPEREPSDG